MVEPPPVETVNDLNRWRFKVAINYHQVFLFSFSARKSEQSKPKSMVKLQ